jgi:hypothetical protein
MARPSVGKIQQPLSDTALFARIASRLEGVRVGDLAEWSDGLGLAVGPDAIRNAVKTADRLADEVSRDSAVRPSALVDYAALGLFVAVVRLQPQGVRAKALDGIAQTPGVVDLLAPRSGEVFAIVVYERPRDEQALEDRLGEFADVVDWQPIKHRFPTASIGTFRTLARNAAKREGLAKESLPANRN